MANYKTIKEILSQTSFNGADAGKLLLISYINAKTDNKKASVSTETLTKILNTLPSKYLQVYTCYETIKEILNILLPQITGYKQQFYNSYNYTTKALKDFVSSEIAYNSYLNTPLMLDKKTLDNITELYKQDFYNTKVTGFNLIIEYLYNLYDIYPDYPEELTEKERAVFDDYKNTPRELEASIDTYMGETDSDKKEAYLQHIVEIFSKIYGLKDNECKQVIDYILEDCKLNSDILGIQKLNSKKNKKADDYIEIIKLYDEYKQNENAYFDIPYKSIFDEEVFLDSLQTLKIDSNKYIELSLFRYREYNAKNYQEFINNFPELYNAVKEDLINSLPLLNTPDSELLNKEFTYRELVAAGILDFDIENSTEFKLQRFYILSKEANTPSQYIIKCRAGAGIGIALTPPTKEDKELFLKYGDDYTGFNFIPEDLELNDIEEYQIKGIRGSLRAINSFNNFLEIYSDLLKVDLLPLKVDIESFKKDFSKFNTLLFQTFSLLKGDKTTITNKKAFLRRTFYPIGLKYTLPDETKTEEYKQFLKALAKKDLVKATSREYIYPILNNSFMEGLNNE